MAVDSMVSGGDIISGSLVRHSLLFSQVVVRSNSLVEESVILPAVTVGQGARIRGAIIDEGCHIPNGTVIGYDTQHDRRRFHVSPSGVVLVTAEMLGQSVDHVR